MLIGMSQEKLGELLGLTFQQVQKYEKGANRIGASRLYEISHILGVPVSYFFDDVPLSEGATRRAGHVPTTTDVDAGPYMMEFVSSAEGFQLVRGSRIRIRGCASASRSGEIATGEEVFRTSSWNCGSQRAA
jgi:transcriptional regulator with XRE-family HTH domain